MSDLKTMPRRTAIAQKPIGVFDSGLGGLTIVREIRRRLPNESIVYYGDLARLPYGTKSKEQILSFSIQNTLFLIKHKVKAVVVACNSSASAAYGFLKNHFNLPVLDVIDSAVGTALATTRTGRIGVIATQATIDSKAYEKSLKRGRAGAKVFQAACPLFVPLVEEGWWNGKITAGIAETYLKPLLKNKVDVLILGCTHYPMLRETLQKAVGKGVTLVDSIEPTVQKLSTLLDKKELSYSGRRQGELKIYVSDSPRNFVRMGETFLGHKMKHVEVVRQK